MSFYGIKIGDEAVWGARFGRRLKDIIADKNLKIPDIAEKMNVTTTMIYSYMHGNTIPNYYKMCRLADALGCDLSYLVDISLD